MEKVLKKRIFIGSFIKIPGFEKHYIKIKKDFGGILAGKWIPEENFHITYRFLGEIEENTLNNIKAQLHSLTNRIFDVDISFEGLGVFPNLNNPRIFYIKVVDRSGVLNEINSVLNEKLAPLGFKEENRPFIPHITLKRVKHYNSKLFINKINSYIDKSFGHQNCVKVDIIHSILTPKGAVYKKVE